MLLEFQSSFWIWSGGQIENILIGGGSHFISSVTEISKILEENISDNEILITQGAGNIADISNSLVAMYK